MKSNYRQLKGDSIYKKNDNLFSGFYSFVFTYRGQGLNQVKTNI